jgi:hypothetical protein
MPFYSGKDGAANFAGEVQVFSKWTLDVRAVDFKTTNFNDAGFASRVAGFIDATVDFEGPYDPTKTKMVARTSGNIVLTVGSTYQFTVPGVLMNISYTQDTGDGARVKGQILSNGTFDLDLSS